MFKNVNQSITDQKIYHDLKQRFPSLIKITRLHKENKPIPVVAAVFSGQVQIGNTLSIKQICNHRVKVEARKKPQGPIQCQRCLDYGHTKNNCNHSISCAFCSGNHYSVTCPNRDQVPKCRNCHGSHPANNRDSSCPYLK